MTDIHSIIINVITYIRVLLYEGLLFLLLQQHMQNKLTMKTNNETPDKTIKGMLIGIKDLA